jgi:hypothetical protein
MLNARGSILRNRVQRLETQLRREIQNCRLARRRYLTRIVELKHVLSMITDVRELAARERIFEETKL